MKDFYYNLGHKKFLLIAAILLLCGDLFFAGMTFHSLGDFDTFYANLDQLVVEAQKSSISGHELNSFREMPKGYLEQVYNMARNILLGFAVIVLLFHSIVYFFLTRGTKFPHYYALMLGFFGWAVCMLTGIFNNLLYLIPAASYAFVFMGLLILGLMPKNLELQSLSAQDVSTEEAQKLDLDGASVPTPPKETTQTPEDS